MRTRAFRPEAPACLESRELLSVAAGPPADPFVYSIRQYNLVINRIGQAFFVYGRNHDGVDLRDEIDNFVVLIPFGKVDGLGHTIDRTLDTMRSELAHHVPRAAGRAQHNIFAAIHEQVLSRVRAGDLIVR